MWSGYAKEGKDYTNSDVINIRNLFGDRILDGTMDGVHTSGCLLYTSSSGQRKISTYPACVSCSEMGR